MLGIIHQILSDLQCYRRLLGGHWYYVCVVVLDMEFTGWVKKPEPHERVLKRERWPMLSAMFGESEFDSANLELNAETVVSIKVFDIIGKNATLPTDGKKLYNATKFLFEAGRTVQFNFRKVNIVTTAFLSFSLGHLIKDCDRKQIKIVGLSAFQEDLVKKVLDNAEVIYGKVTQ